LDDFSNVFNEKKLRGGREMFLKILEKKGKYWMWGLLKVEI